MNAFTNADRQGGRVIATPGTTYFRADGNRLTLSGAWTAFTVPLIGAALGRDAATEAIEILDLSGLTAMDTAGAMLVRRTFPGRPLENAGHHNRLFDFLPSEAPPPPSRRKGGFVAAIAGTGRTAADIAVFTYGILCFTGVVFMRLLSCFAHPRRFRLAAIVRHIDETGIRALPIVGLLGFLMSMVVSYQAAIQLQKFGASIFTIDLTVISLLREMGVLITAIMVAGRSGSAFAAEIGVMKLREEVDALRTIGMDPVETLVLPRLLALVITLPLLTFFANMIGLAGGAVMAQAILDIPLGQYMSRVEHVATPTMFFVGMVKAPVFAFLISIVCTFQGMSVSGSAESVGRLTTMAVVQSIFLVIVADAIFSIIFSNLGI